MHHLPWEVYHAGQPGHSDNTFRNYNKDGCILMDQKKNESDLIVLSYFVAQHHLLLFFVGMEKARRGFNPSEARGKKLG